MIEMPEILNIPKKLLPLITKINDYSYFLIEGGRGGGKSQSVARLILWIAEERYVRICCGREVQRTIEDSVYKILVDIINEYSLNFTVLKNKIIHNKTKSEIIFRGFREQGRVNIKGLEGVDILWIDEAQAIVKSTLDIIIPTIRRENAIVYFTMNRYIKSDAVYCEFVNDKRCLHLKINYYDNEFCPANLIEKAQKCKENNIKDYSHIWEGNPIELGEDYLISSEKLDRCANLEFGGRAGIRSMGVDLSGQGGDFCVATLVEGVGEKFKVSNREIWKNPDTDSTKGKIISLYAKWHPDIVILDADGLGYPIFVSVKKVIERALEFHGSGAPKRENAYNERADGYLTLKEFIDNEWISIPFADMRAQIELIKKEYCPSGKIKIQKKSEMKLELGQSPDLADSLMMAVYALNYYSYMAHNNDEVQVMLDTGYDPFE